MMSSKAEQIRTFLDKVTAAQFDQVTIKVRDSIGRMLLAVYENQTQDEQSIMATKHRNGLGFNAMDATFLSDLAQRSQRYNYMTIPQAKAAAKSLRKYAAQIAQKAA